jgi:hypothetical protein
MKLRDAERADAINSSVVHEAIGFAEELYLKYVAAVKGYLDGG